MCWNDSEGVFIQLSIQTTVDIIHVTDHWIGGILVEYCVANDISEMGFL